MTRLTEWPWLSAGEQRGLRNYAIRWFHKDEDRKDFLQTAYTIMWRYWRLHGYKLIGKDNRLHSLAPRLLNHSARYAAFGQGKKEQLLSFNPWSVLERQVRSEPLGDILDRFVPKNKHTQSRTKMFKLKCPNGASIRFSYTDLEELTGRRRDNLFNMASRGTPIRVEVSGLPVVLTWDQD